MVEEKKYKKPLPRLDEESKGFWEACQRHELYVQKCGACGVLRHYPRALCPCCLSSQTEWVLSSGRGTVYTYTVTYQNQSPGFRDELPYVLAYVELNEGVRLLTDIIGCAPEDVKIGMPVQVTFEEATRDVSLPKFKPLELGILTPTLSGREGEKASLMILDLHTHSVASEDSRAPVETYLKWLAHKRDVLPIDGIVLTEHRQWNPAAEHRALEDKFGILILRGAEVETDYGHVLVYGVNEDMTRRFDFTNVRLPARELIPEVARMGGIAVPCHPGRPTVGLCEHYEKQGPLDGVVAVEALNGGSRRGENERVQQLIERYGYHAFGGSDSHLVSFIGICATEFQRDIRTVEDLVQALYAGGYRPVDFRDRLKK